MSRWIYGFLAGGAIGATIALLYAPQAGEETRTLIRDKSYETRNKVMSAYDEGRAKAEKMVTDVVDEARLKAGRLKSVGQEAVSTHKMQLDQDLRKAQEAVQS